VLLADAARRLTRPWLGIALGIAVAFARMATFFDGLVLGESLLFFLGSALAWCVVRARGRAPTWRDAALWGALTALLAEGRATSALLLLPALALAWGGGAPRRAALARVAALLAAFALVAAPAAIRNSLVAREWLPFTYNGGYNLAVGANPAANGGFVSVTGTHDIVDPTVAGADGGIESDGRRYIEETTGLRLSPGESSRWWARRALAWMAAHPRRAAGLAARKLALAWSRRESPQIENVDEFRRFAGPVGLPWLGSFAVLAALAFAGAFAGWRRGAEERWLALSIAVLTLALVPFFVTDRYRHQLVPPALLLAAVAVDALVHPARGRRAGPAPWGGAALGAALALWPVPHLATGRYEASLASDVGARWLDRGRADRAEPELARAIAMDTSGVVRWNATPDDSFSRAALHFEHARALAALGRGSEALAELQRAARLAPGSREIAAALAASNATGGDVTRAWSLAAAGDLAGADTAFARVVAREPSRYDVWAALVRLRAQAGRKGEALAALQSGRAAGWQGPGYDAHAALVLALEGHLDDARRLIAQVPAAAAASDPALADVVRVVQRLVGK